MRVGELVSSLIFPPLLAAQVHDQQLTLKDCESLQPRADRGININNKPKADESETVDL